jgi:hypothetical protein
MTDELCLTLLHACIAMGESCWEGASLLGLFIMAETEGRQGCVLQVVKDLLFNRGIMSSAGQQPAGEVVPMEP